MFKEIRQNTVFNVSTSCLLQKLDSILKNKSKCGEMLTLNLRFYIRYVNIWIAAFTSAHLYWEY